MSIEYLPYFWFGLSMAFFFLEAYGITGIGFLFSALAALCMGIIMQNGWIDARDTVAQAATFFGLTGLWAAILWKPLKKFRMSRPTQTHNDMIGRFATVTEGGLQKGKSGHVHWSGTLMRARLAEDAAIDAAEAGEELKIIAVQGATLILAESSYLVEDKN